jgi:hypothetical protein
VRDEDLEQVPRLLGLPFAGRHRDAAAADLEVAERANRDRWCARGECRERVGDAGVEAHAAPAQLILGGLHGIAVTAAQLRRDQADLRLPRHVTDRVPQLGGVIQEPGGGLRCHGCEREQLQCFRQGGVQPQPARDGTRFGGVLACLLAIAREQGHPAAGEQSVDPSGVRAPEANRAFGESPGLREVVGGTNTGERGQGLDTRA